MMDYVIDTKKSKFTKTKDNYFKDSVFDMLDVDGELRTSKAIPRINEDIFLFAKDLTKQSVPNKKEKLIHNSHSINVFEVLKEISENSGPSKLFEVIDFIGEGSFGVVISAWDLQVRKKIAIKIIPKYKFSKNVREEYLEREVNIQSNVNNKHIVKLFGIKESNDYLCLLMELCEGGSLKDFIINRYYSNNEEFLKEEECVTIVKKILKGLDYMFSLSIMHRDIKPGNNFDKTYRKYHV